MTELIVDNTINMLLERYIKNNQEGYLVCRKKGIKIDNAERDLVVTIVNNFEKIKENTVLREHPDYFYIPLIYFEHPFSKNATKNIEDYHKKDPFPRMFWTVNITDMDPKYKLQKYAEIPDISCKYKLQEYVEVKINDGKVDRNIGLKKYYRRSTEELEKAEPNYIKILNSYKHEVDKLISEYCKNLESNAN